MKAWETKEWKTQRSKFLEGKKCEWCGSTNQLVMHNLKPPPPYSLLLRQVSSDLLKRKVEEGKFATQMKRIASCPNCSSSSLRKRIGKRPVFKCQKCRFEFNEPIIADIDTGRLAREDWDRFWGEYGSLVKDQVTEIQKKEQQGLNLDNYIALCKRCHMACRSGFVLCPVCKQGYARMGREMCWECFKKTDKGKEIALQYEKESIVHPWCRKTFMVEHRWIGLLSDPFTCCTEACELGPEACSIAQGFLESKPPADDKP